MNDPWVAPLPSQQAAPAGEAFAPIPVAHPDTWPKETYEQEWVAPNVEREASGDDFVPITATIRQAPRLSPVVLGLAAIVTIALLVGWRVAEVKIVDRDPWPYWDVTWIVLALLSIAAIAGWIMYLRRLWQERQDRRNA